MDNVAVLIPVYNEEKTISKVVKDCLDSLKNINNAHVYVYDNNSSDNTVALAEKAGAIIRHEYRQGKGNVIRRMFQEIDANCYIMIDGDDTYPVENIPSMVEKVLSKNSDMVVGDRLSSSYFEENKRFGHGFGNKLVRKSINVFFKNDIRDIMTGYRAFSYRFVKTYPVLSKGFEIETEMSILAIENNMQVDNEIITYRDRPEGSESKLDTFSDGFKVLATIFKLFKNYHPFKLFSIISLILVAISVISFIPSVWLPFLQTGIVDKIPTLIVDGFLLVTGILLFSSGLILDSIVQKEKREFEFRLQSVTFQKINTSKNDISQKH